MAKTLTYQRHVESHIFPKMSSEEFSSLVLSMKENGFDTNFPILLYENQIVDGWHRYQAALESKVQPIFKEWNGSPKALRSFIIYANGTRRHLSKAQHAAALHKANLVRPGNERMSDGDIAQLTGSSRSTVEEQKRIRELNPKIADDIVDGKTTATVGRRRVLREQPKAEVFKILTDIPQALSKRVREVAPYLGETNKRFVHEAVRERLEREEAKQKAEQAAA